MAAQFFVKWVIYSTINIDVIYMERSFQETGSNGYAGSIDTIYVEMLSCDSWAHIMHKEYKINILSSTYSMIASHVF